MKAHKRSQMHKKVSTQQYRSFQCALLYYGYVVFHLSRQKPEQRAGNVPGNEKE